MCIRDSTRIDHSDTMGMLQEDYERFSRMLHSPNGIIYLTGPTGSGKTTTLYMVLEEPVSYTHLDVYKRQGQYLSEAALPEMRV